MNETYVSIFDRSKAAVIDSIIMIVLMYAASMVFSLFDTVPNYARMIVWSFIFVLYDPLLTSFNGGTVGHTYIGITVRKEEDTKRHISFLYAVLRFIIKFFLGWISLLIVTGNAKKRALHDFAAGSVVIEIVED